jgi:hypothetical protein
MGRYLRLNIAEFAEKTYTISGLLAKIIPVTISPNFYEIYITNYFVGVMNDVILMIESPKLTLFYFYLISLVEY